MENTICGVLFKRIDENNIEVYSSDGKLYKTIQKHTLSEEDFHKATNEYFIYNY